MNKTMPFGRINEYVATLTDDQKRRTATMRGQGIFDNWTVKTFKNREAMAKAIRKQQTDGEIRCWSPVVKLETTEGY